MRPSFDPRSLYYFHIVSETGSMSAASELLAVSQPTLSRTVSTLEAQAGRQLMVRGRHGVMLTEAGILLAEQGRQIAADLKGADDVLNQLKTNSPPTIRLGFGPLIALAAGNDFVTNEINSDRKRTFQLQIGTARQLITDLLHNRLDIAVMATPPNLRVEHLQTIPVIDDHISLFTGAGSALSTTQTPLNKQELAKARWVTIEAAFGPRSSHQNMLKQFGLPDTQTVVHYNMNIHGMLDALVKSDALCFLPARLTKLLAGEIGITEIPLGRTTERRQIGIWHAADADLNNDLADTIKKARSYLSGRLMPSERPDHGSAKTQPDGQLNRM